MQSVSDASFLPNGDVTRAQVVTILWRLEDKPAANYAMQFADVATGDWYAEAVRWAAANGVVTGYGDMAFGPNDPHHPRAVRGDSVPLLAVQGL